MSNQTIPTVQTGDAQFDAAFANWLEKAQQAVDEHMKQFGNLPREVLVPEVLQNYVRVWKRSITEHTAGERRGSAYAFIALRDNQTNALGVVKRGDVMKPASWKVPAKHARGNLFDATGGLGQVGAYGPAYLK